MWSLTFFCVSFCEVWFLVGQSFLLLIVVLGLRRTGDDTKNNLFWKTSLPHRLPPLPHARLHVHHSWPQTQKMRMLTCWPYCFRKSAKKSSDIGVIWWWRRFVLFKQWCSANTTWEGVIFEVSGFPLWQPYRCAHSTIFAARTSPSASNEIHWPFIIDFVVYPRSFPCIGGLICWPKWNCLKKLIQQLGLCRWHIDNLGNKILVNFGHISFVSCFWYPTRKTGWPPVPNLFQIFPVSEKKTEFRTSPANSLAKHL